MKPSSSSRSGWSTTQRRWCSTSFEEYIRWEFNAVLWISLIGVTWFLLRALFRVLIIRLTNPSREIQILPSFLNNSGLIVTAAESSNNPLKNLNALLIELYGKYGSVVKLWFAPTQLLVPISEQTLINESLLKAEDKLQTTKRSLHDAFGPSRLVVLSSDETFSEIISAQNDSSQEDTKIYTKMLSLLSKIDEAARLCSAGPLLHRCTLDQDVNLETAIKVPMRAVLVAPLICNASEFNPDHFVPEAEEGYPSARM